MTPTAEFRRWGIFQTPCRSAGLFCFNEGLHDAPQPSLGHLSARVRGTARLLDDHERLGTADRGVAEPGPDRRAGTACRTTVGAARGATRCATASAGSNVARAERVAGERPGGTFAR